MSKSDKENVIDLCSSSDEDDVESVKRVATKQIAPIFDSSSSDNKGILGASRPNPYQIKKRQRLDTNAEIAATQPAVKLASEQHPMLLFISGEGRENATVTDDIVALLNDFPNIQSCVTTAAVLLRMLHIQQLDKWSCGFRNVQMLLSSVIPLLPTGHPYYQLHPDSREEGYCSIPSVLRLQELMEQSWAAGYDRQGAEHYHHKIVGSSKKIGAAEVSNLLSFCGIENAVIQFISCIESRSLLGPLCLSYFSKLQHNHFQSCCRYQTTSGKSSQALALHLLSISKTAQTGGERLCTCPVLPLYLQWEGHSVTIVGVEPDIRGERNGSVKNLLVFDPSATGSMLKKSLQMRNLQPLRFPLSKLKGKDCQIIVISLEPLSCAEQEQLKRSMRSVTAATDAVRRALNCR
jgi:Peptidase family C78